MKTAGGSADAKRRAGEQAAQEVEDGFVVGLGTGSTTAYAIEAIGDAVADGLEVRGIPTSFQSRQLALEVGIPLTTLDAVETVDLAIDGADLVVDDPGSPAHGTLIKGGGAAHAREKLVDAAADRFVVVADPSKLADRLERSVPLEVLPAAHSVVADRVRDLSGDPSLRAAEHKDGPVVTDNGNLVLDCEFGPIDDPEELASTLSSVPGVVEHGLFVDLADATYVGTEDGLEVRAY
ncbi:ribose-5-phosphate isomerase RpiA [Natrarchaeobaculum sulfurireducens]|uniref:Ribose-5-phosphate isomerase A n=1 Tax=Natrarchaeobaculum sulfurireducens TaxID=2044521 RepID=A0A346PA27_9EURY|nr:ribose-5-phosphate isomerase RpiA [Natrarchaeobaculum sulfurireducens]AXR76372.1 Ribose 5-phosphate isomerase [Natrarchaeobaculum sulfurireducens]AXR80050.1 Ribose 5-phosphate isomerase A [Natrarchaeobaculum sulfurireducens]